MNHISRKGDVLRSMLLLAGLVSLGLLLLGLTADGDADSRYHTYHNEQFGYGFSYPAEWTLEVRDPQSTDDFTFQRAVVRENGGGPTTPGGRVGVIVNFFGDWCVGMEETTITAIVGSGIDGKEYVCSQTPDSTLIVLFFQGAKGQQNYTVMGHAEGAAGLEIIRRIMDSFEFTD